MKTGIYCAKLKLAMACVVACFLLLQYSTANAAVVISEFMASNSATLADEDGEFSDWIELHNNGSSAVNINGWYLTDDDGDLTQWQFPSRTLAPNARLVIFASDKDRRGAELHTNFKLGSGGEYLGLIRANGSTVADQYAPEYPPQISDQSYGIPASGPRNFLTTPTPGSANSVAALPRVTFSPESGVFVNSETITLTPTSALQAGQQIHYTVNGADPTSSSPIYVGPFTRNSTSRIKARVLTSNREGAVGSASYIRLNSGVASVTASLPMVVIDTLGSPVSTDGSTYTPVSIAVFDRGAGGRSSLTSTPEFAGFGGIRVRGSSSAGFPKKQYKLEVWDGPGGTGPDPSPDLDVNLLDLGSESDWVLYAPGRYDRSYIANPLMQQLSGELGLEEMKTQFVEVFLDADSNGVSGSDYVGLYVLTESIKIGSKRVDIEKLATSDNTLPRVSGGYILGIDRSSSDKQNISTPHPSSGNIVVHRPKKVDLSAAQASWITDYVYAFELALYGPNPSNPSTGYPAYIDVPSWIDQHILRTFAMDPDSLRLSNYFYKDRGGKLFNSPVWDFDRTLNSDDPRDDNPQQIWVGNSGVDPFTWSWWGELFADPAFENAYNARWNALRAGPLSRNAIFTRINALAAEISESYNRENARWGSTPGYGSRYGNLAGEINAMKDWIDLRLAYLDSQFTAPSALTVSDVTVNEGAGIATVTVSLTSPSTSTVSVGAFTRAGSAQGGGSDFFGTTVNPLTFAPGQTTKTFQINIVDDSIPEPDEQFQVRLFNPVGATISDQVATITIIDNDTNNSPVLISGAPLTVAENVGTAPVVITLSRAASTNVVVSYATVAASAQPGSDFYGKGGTLTFTPGQVQKTVPITILNDSTAESQELFRLRLFGASGGSIDTPLVPVSINDDDGQATAQFSTQNVIVSESDNTATVVINLSQGVNADVTVFTQALTAQGGGQDYRGLTQVVSFRNGQTSRAVTVQIINDNTSEPNEALRLRLTNPVGATNAIPPYANITIIDDD